MAAQGGSDTASPFGPVGRGNLRPPRPRAHRPRDQRRTCYRYTLQDREGPAPAARRRSPGAAVSGMQRVSASAHKNGFSQDIRGLRHVPHSARHDKAGALLAEPPRYACGSGALRRAGLRPAPASAAPDGPAAVDHPGRLRSRPRAGDIREPGGRSGGELADLYSARLCERARSPVSGDLLAARIRRRDLRRRPAGA